MKQYKLLKDLPNVKAGVLLTQVTDELFNCDNHYTFMLHQIESNPDWFQEVKPFEWTDELVREYAGLVETYVKSNLYPPKFTWQFTNMPTIENFKKSKQHANNGQ